MQTVKKLAAAAIRFQFIANKTDRLLTTLIYLALYSNTGGKSYLLIKMKSYEKNVTLPECITGVVLSDDFLW